MLFPHPSLVQFSAWNVQSKLRKIWNWLRLRHSHTHIHIYLGVCVCVWCWFLRFCCHLQVLPLGLPSLSPSLSLPLWLPTVAIPYATLRMRNNNHIDKLIIWLYDYDNACQSHSEPDARQVWVLRAASTIADYNTYKLTKVNLLKVNRTTAPQTPIQTPQTHTYTQQQTLMCNKSNKADDDAIGLGDWA